jgi:hypothetical protein
MGTKRQQERRELDVLQNAEMFNTDWLQNFYNKQI